MTNFSKKTSEISSKKLSLVPYHWATIFEDARTTQNLWKDLSFKERANYLYKIGNYLTDHCDEIALKISKCTTKTRIEALSTEVIPAKMACEWYAKNTQRYLAPDRLKSSSLLFLNKKNVLHHLPLGVVGIISPWNYPFSIPFGEILMGLMAGNAVMLKVDEHVLPVGRLIQTILEEVQLPRNLFYLFEGDPEGITDEWFLNKIDKIFFTGSVRVGKILLEKSVTNLTPLCLELGGKDPMIVLEDADLERSVNGAAWAGFQNAGQTCAGVERVYVHEKIYNQFLSRLTNVTEKMHHGFDDDFKAQMGGITTKKQYDSITKQVDQALSNGAKILAQSKPLENCKKGLFYPATILINVDHSMEIMQEETFGPIICVMKFSTIEEAIKLANDSKYALTSSVWSRNTKKAKEIAKKLQTGTTTINDHLLTHGMSETPWGGWKDSGIGRTHGQQGLHEMTQSKLINWDTLPLKRNIYWYPFNKETYDGLKSALSFMDQRLNLIEKAKSTCAATLFAIKTISK